MKKRAPRINGEKGEGSGGRVETAPGRERTDGLVPVAVALRNWGKSAKSGPISVRF